MSQENASREYRYQSIQALRALAALMVVVLHSHIAFGSDDKARLLWWPGFSDFGWLGVDLFFVISGFIIAYVISKPGFSIPSYVRHRFWRIVPLYWLVMLIALYYYRDRGWWSYYIDEFGTAGMVKSFLILPQKAHPFWEPGWSLEHEVLFYAIAAIVAPLAGLWSFAAVMIALGIVGFVFPLGWDFHLFSNVQILFGAGVIAYLLRNQTWRAAAPLGAAGLIATYGHLYGIWSLTTPLLTCTSAVGFASLLVTLLDVERHGSRRGWSFPRFLVLIGNASFSLYLWHWLFIPFISRWRPENSPPELWRWIFVAISLTAAIASYQLIEKPLIKFSHKKWRKPARPVAAE